MIKNFEADVVVVGAGHNALISAAYLAGAGQKVLVLEGQSRAGGDTMTAELTLPGFHHDVCSTAHTLIQSNPMLRNRELPLDRYGLEYIRPDPVCTVSFGPGESLTMYREVERTEREIGRVSPHDALAYRRLLADWTDLKPLQSVERGAPPLDPESSARLWRSGPLGDEGLRLKLASALEVIQERFQHPSVQTFMAWLASMTLEPIDEPGTGLLAFSLAAGRQDQSWVIPRGGSGELPAALIRFVRDHGGEVICDSRVREIVIENGRAVGAVTDDGTEYRAGRGVLSSAHITQLPAAIGSAIDEDLSASIGRWRTGLTMFVGHYALNEAPRYATQGESEPAVAMGVLSSIDNLRAILADFRRGRVRVDEPFLLCLSPSVADATRAPAGHHTLKVIAVLPYALRDGSKHWDEIKDAVADRLLDVYLSRTSNLRREHVLGYFIESPLDLERRNPNNFKGSCHGGAGAADQSGWYRPAPLWNGYRTPLPGFYLTGACTHPGGSVSGLPGRNAARVIFEDFGLNWERATGGLHEVA
ncbi:MAG: phytoene desaturase family protein [Chloroflexota bacterium]